MSQKLETSTNERSRRRQIRLEPPPRAAKSIPTLKPPARSRQAEPKAGAGWQRWATGLLFLVLGTAAVAVFAVLPGWVEERQGQAPIENEVMNPAPAEPSVSEAPASSIAPPAVAPLEASQADDRRRAEEALFQLTRARRAVEERGVEQWGGEAYDLARRQAEIGDEFLTSRRFADAADAYEEAIQRFEELDDRRPEVLAQALQEGEAALAASDALTATRAFELARAIDPENARAERGLARAAVADEVAELLATASERENAADTSGAARAYREALRLDPATEAARQALARLGAQQATRSFNQAMSEGLAALDRGAFAAAREAFLRASEQRPEARESADGLARAEAGLRREAIEGWRAKASDLEAAESWREAAKAYHEVLKIDPTVAFAQAGLRRASQRAELVDKLDQHLASPDRLAAREVLNEASTLLGQGRDLKAIGPKMRQRLDRLEGLIGEYSTPILARLLSDELTDVTIYKVGHLGAFSSHALELRPGTYTVVGSRKGYRDVRRQLVIRPGVAPEPLTIRCEEEI